MATLETSDFEVYSGDSVTTDADADLAVALSSWGGAGGSSIDDHSLGTENYVNGTLETAPIGGNQIYSVVGYILDADIPAGSNTFTATLTPSLALQVSSAIFVSGANQTTPITGHDVLAGSGATAFPNMTSTCQAGDIVVYTCQMTDSAATITTPADNGSDSWTDQGDWSYGSAPYENGKAYTLTATETHTSATVAAGENAAGTFFYNSHIFVIETAAATGDIAIFRRRIDEG